MTIWTVPLAAVVGVMLALLYLNLLCMRINRVAFNICNYLADKEGSGVLQHTMGGYLTRSTPGWARFGGWVASFCSLAVMVYVGMRFGWLWALGYAVVDHLLKSLEIPIVPTISQAYGIVEKQVEKAVPQISDEVAAYRDSYEHE